MEKIPTAWEFMKGKNFSIPSIEEMMKTFAKMHVEAALKEAFEKVEIDYTYEGSGGEFDDHPIYRHFVKKDSILNSYPLENIN